MKQSQFSLLLWFLPHEMGSRVRYNRSLMAFCEKRRGVDPCFCVLRPSPDKILEGFFEVAAPPDAGKGIVQIFHFVL